MSRVNWGAKSEWEFIANYKVLQSACDKLGVDKKIDVDRLIKARQQDNLEFLQWLKKFYDDNASGAASDYDPVARRAIGKGASSMKWCKPSSGAVGSSAISPQKVSTVRPVRTTASPNSTSPAKASSAATTGGVAAKREPIAVAKPSAAAGGTQSTSAIEHATVVTTLKAEVDAYRKQLEAHREESEARLARLESQLKQCESERDYYFGKLKNVELAIQALPADHQDGKLVLTTISHVLYDEDPSTVSEEAPSKTSEGI